MLWMPMEAEDGDASGATCMEMLRCFFRWFFRLPTLPGTDIVETGKPYCGGLGKGVEERTLNEVLENRSSGEVLYKKEGAQRDAPSLVQSNEMMVPDLPLIYKSRLQELAQRKNWSSPIYSHVREGPSHNPHFKATVTVEGKSFESPEFFSTLREAEHSAAKVAFASLPDEGIPEEKSVPFKYLLQELAQKKGLLLPVYTTIKSGASHLPTFQSTVQIDGEIFSGKAATAKKESEANAAKVAWTTLKERGKSFESSSSALHEEGEHSGAKVAFASFSDEGIPVENLVHLKNTLQEHAQKKGRLLPVYTTIKSGASHSPTFQSTVQIDGETFSGKAATTKKEAEMNAAKVALSTLKERGLTIAFQSQPLFSKENDLNIRSSPTQDIEVDKRSILDNDRDGVSVSPDDSLEKGISGLEPDQEAAVSSSFATDMYTYLQQQFFGDSSFTEASKMSKSPSGQPELYTTSSSSIPPLNNEEQKGSGALGIGSTGISKQRNKVVVFPRWGNVKLPEGVIEEFSDKKWVAVTTGSDHGSK